MIGGFSSTILIALLEFILGPRWRKIPESLFEVIDGIVSSIIAFYMFLLLSVPVSFLVPIILSVCSFVWYSARKEREKSYWNIFGVFIGWFLII